MYKGRKVLVAGGTGVLGIPIVHELVKRGATVEVVGMENKSDVTKYLPAEVKYTKRNLLEIEQCRAAIRGQEIVINLAGTKRSVGIGYKNISKFLVSMLNLQTNIMDVSHSEGVERFLFVGSICEYPALEIRSEDEVWSGKPQQNDWIPGVQKRIGEVQAEAYFLDTGWDAVRIVRPSNVYGPFDNFSPLTGQVIPSLISKLLKNPETLDVLGDGSNIRDFIYADDVAFWSLEALEKAPHNFPINIGSGNGSTIAEIAETLVRIYKSNTEIRYSSQVPSGDRKRILDMSRASEVIGYFSRTPLEQGLVKTLQWAKENPEWIKEKYV
jgi:GDP-L-fucose synthase